MTISGAWFGVDLVDTIGCATSFCTIRQALEAIFQV